MPRTRVRLFPFLLAAFLIVPIIEIYLLIQVGGLIGALPTIGLVVLTAVLGAAMLRIQGFQTYLRFQRSLSKGRYPATEMLEGVALLVGGVLLLTPGFFTDAIGFVCLLPWTRRALVAWSVSRFLNAFKNAVYTSQARTSRGNVYEGEVTRHNRPEDCGSPDVSTSPKSLSRDDPRPEKYT